MRMRFVVSTCFSFMQVEDGVDGTCRGREGEGHTARNVAGQRAMRVWAWTGGRAVVRLASRGGRRKRPRGGELTV